MNERKYEFVVTYFEDHIDIDFPKDIPGKDKESIKRNCERKKTIIIKMMKDQYEDQIKNEKTVFDQYSHKGMFDKEPKIVCEDGSKLTKKEYIEDLKEKQKEQLKNGIKVQEKITITDEVVQE